MKPIATGRVVATPHPERLGQLSENIMTATINSIPAGSRTISLPAGVYNWVLVKNNSGHRITIRLDNALSMLSILGIVEPYMTDSIPIPRGIDQLFVSWSGTTLPEVAILYFMVDNPGMINQFRTPAASPDRVVFAGVAAVSVLVTAVQKVIVRAVYVVNTATSASNLTLAHRIGTVDRHLLSNVAIPANSTHALGHMVLEAGQDLRITAFTGTITVLVYGEGN